MESDIIEESNFGSASTDDDDDDDDDDDSELKELNEKLRAAEEFSRELKLRNRTKTELESVLHTPTAKDDDQSPNHFDNHFEEELLNQDFEESEISAEKIEAEIKHQKTSENVDLESNLSTSSDKETLEQTLNATENVEEELKLIKHKNIKNLKSLKRKSDLHKLLIEKSLKKKIKTSALYTKELPKTTENIDLNSNKSHNKSQNVLEKKSLNQQIEETGSCTNRIGRQLRRRVKTENIKLESGETGNDRETSKEQNLDEKLRAAGNRQKEQKLLKRNSKCNLKSLKGKPGPRELMDEKSESCSETAEMNEDVTLQNTTENIDLKFNSIVNDNTSLEELLEEKILNKKLRAAKRFGRELKLLKHKNITFKSESSVSGECNSELLKGNPDLHKLLSNKNKEEALDIVNKALSVNLHKQAFLSNWEKCIENALEKNLNLQELLAKSARRAGMKKRIKTWNNYTSVVFGMSYFKEKDKTMSCPPNADKRLRTARNHLLIPARDDYGKWSSKETSKLKQSVLETLRDKIIANISIEIDGIRRSNDGSKKKDVPSKLQTNQIDFLNRKINKVRAMSLMELIISENRIDDDNEWRAISLHTFTGYRSPNECQAYFEMCLDPTLNHDKWTKEEDEKLLLLADKYSCQDWDAITSDLGTNRSAYECCLHFERELDRNVRAVGKWSKEEDDKLIEAVRTFRVGNHIPWTKVSCVMTTRSVWQIKNRWIESLAPHRKKGRFSAEEDKLILKAIEEHGRRSFRSVASLFPDRTAIQIRARFQRKMENTKIKGRWTLEEDQVLLQLVEKIGVGNWKEMSDHLTTRTRTQIRQRYNQIKSFMYRYPGLDVSEMHRVESKKSDNKVTTKSETVVSSANSSVAENQTEEKITETADVSVDSPNTRRTSKRKSVVSESSSVEDIKPPPTKRTRRSYEGERRYDNILKTINKKAHQRSPAAIKLISYFQEAYPMQSIVGKKTWDEADIVAQAQGVFDLSHILKVDFSYINDVNRQKSVRPYMLKQTVKKLIQNHGDELLRLNPVTSDHPTDDAPLDVAGAPAPAACDVACESDASSSTTLLDVPPLPVEETVLCPDPFPDELVDQFQSSPKEEKEEEEEKPVEPTEKQMEELIQAKKKEFMDFPFLVPPNVATAVGYRSLLLVERKLSNKVAAADAGADEADEESEAARLPPDYICSEFRMKDEEKVRASEKVDMDKCVRFTKEEAIHMFKERLKILFAGPIVMGDCADRYFNVNNLPVYKKEGQPNKYQRRTTADHYQKLQNSKMASLAERISKDIHIQLEATTETPYSMPNLDSEENCEPSTSKSHDYNCQPSTSKSLDYCQPSTSQLFNDCQPSTSNLFDDCQPSTSKLFDDCQPSTSKLFDDCQPSTSTSENFQPTTSKSLNRPNCNRSTSSSSLGESNSSLVDKKCPRKQKCPVKPKKSSSKTLDVCQPGTSKSDNCQPSTSRSVNSITLSSLGPSEEKE